MIAPMQKLSEPPFQGFRFPNTTPVPDELFDDLLADLSGAEVKVILYICRRTFGFKKESDTISISQMTGGIQKKDGDQLDRGTGLSKDSVARAVKGLEEKGVILRTRRRSEAKGDEPTTYRLNILPVSENRTPPGEKIGHGEGVKSDTQDTVLQETVRQATVNGNKKTCLEELPDLDQPKEKREYVAQFILDALDDEHSYPFYLLVAAKVPEKEIRQVLAEIKTDGARNPAKVFTHRMKLYAIQQQKRM
jgi:DNA-binding Lrp family transcriptional regulator